MALPLVLVVWLAISIPVAMVTGRAIGRRVDSNPPPQASERLGLLARLEELELREIPRVQRAIAGWVDDPYLAGDLRELRAEAERLRTLLDRSAEGSSHGASGRGPRAPRGRSAA